MDGNPSLGFAGFVKSASGVTGHKESVRFFMGGLMRLLLIALALLVSTSAQAGNSTSLAGLPAPLVAKVQEIVSACGSKVVSTFRSGAHTPSGHLSNHARHKAADVQGNPSCIYAHLRGQWSGGYSTDYARAPGGPHVHISYNPGGMEWGLRFVHYHPPRRTRLAVASGAAHHDER